jgi:hypothetical protein
MIRARYTTGSGGDGRVWGSGKMRARVRCERRGDRQLGLELVDVVGFLNVKLPIKFVEETE